MPGCQRQCVVFPPGCGVGGRRWAGEVVTAHQGWHGSGLTVTAAPFTAAAFLVLVANTPAALLRPNKKLGRHWGSCKRQTVRVFFPHLQSLWGATSRLTRSSLSRSTPTQPPLFFHALDSFRRKPTYQSVTCLVTDTQPNAFFPSDAEHSILSAASYYYYCTCYTPTRKQALRRANRSQLFARCDCTGNAIAIGSLPTSTPPPSPETSEARNSIAS